MAPPHLRSVASLSSVRLSVERERDREKSSLGKIQEDGEDGVATTAAQNALHRVKSPLSIASGHTSAGNASPTRLSFSSDISAATTHSERRNKRQTMLSKVFTPSSPLDDSPPLFSKDYFPIDPPTRELEALLSNDLETTVNGVQMLLLTQFHKPLDAKYNPQIARVLESYAKLKDEIDVLKSINEKHTTVIVEANQRLRQAEERNAEMKELYLEEIKRMEVQIATDHGLEQVTLMRTGTVLSKAQRSRPSRRESQAGLDLPSEQKDSEIATSEKHSVIARSTWRNRARSNASIDQGALPSNWANSKSDSVMDGLMTLSELLAAMDTERSTDGLAVRRVAQILSNRTNLSTSEGLQMVVSLLFQRPEILLAYLSQGHQMIPQQSTQDAARTTKVKTPKQKKDRPTGNKKEGGTTTATAAAPGILETLGARISKSPKQSSKNQRKRANTIPADPVAEELLKENLEETVVPADRASIRTAYRASSGYHSDPERPSSRPMSFMEGDDRSISGKHYLRNSIFNTSRTSVFHVGSLPKPPLERRRSKSTSDTIALDNAPIKPLMEFKEELEKVGAPAPSIPSPRRSTNESTHSGKSIFDKPRIVRPALRHMATESVITLTAFARSHGKSKDRMVTKEQERSSAARDTIPDPTVTSPSKSCQDVMHDIGIL